MRKIDNKKIRAISYSFYDITGKGFCPIVKEEIYDIVCDNLKVLTAGSFLAKGCVVSIQGQEVLPVTCDLIFHTYANDEHADDEPYDWKQINQDTTYPTIGIAMTSGFRGDFVEVAMNTGNQGFGDAVCGKCGGLIVHIEDGCPDCGVILNECPNCGVTIN